MTSSRFCPGRNVDPRDGHWQSRFKKKKGAPTCAGAPQRSGHCRVCAQTVVLGAANISSERISTPDVLATVGLSLSMKASIANRRAAETYCFGSELSSGSVVKDVSMM